MFFIILILRFALPLFFLKWPFGASLANFIVDSVDGDLLMSRGMESDIYQFFDKFFDYFSYVAMLFVGFKWKIRREILLTFLLRTVGQALFFLTGKEVFFFFFPNFLEPLFIFFAFLLLVKKDESYLWYRKNWVLIWGLILVYKFLNEWLGHVVNIDFSEYLFGKETGLFRLKK